MASQKLYVVVTEAELKGDLYYTQIIGVFDNESLARSLADAIAKHERIEGIDYSLINYPDYTNTHVIEFTINDFRVGATTLSINESIKRFLESKVASERGKGMIEHLLKHSHVK